MDVLCYTLSEDASAPIEPGLMARAIASLPSLFPGLEILESPFAVPGRGEVAGVALDAAGRCTLIELSATAVGGLPDAVCRRLEWFNDNLGLLHRIFPGRACAPLEPQVALLAPSFQDGFVHVAAYIATVFAFRIRPLRSDRDDALLIEPVGGTPSATAWLRPPEPQTETPAPETPATAPSSAAAYRPPHATPQALRDRALDWLRKLGPDITSAPLGDGRTAVAYRDQTLATITIAGDQLLFDVPSAGRFEARDGHAVNRAMQHVIARFFKLVEPRSSVTRALRREDILTDREFAELQ